MIANLGNLGVQVPGGFATTASAFDRFLDGVVDGMDLLDVRFAEGRQAIEFGPAGERPNPNWDDRLDADRYVRVDRRDADRVIEQFGVGWNRP